MNNGIPNELEPTEQVSDTTTSEPTADIATNGQRAETTAVTEPATDNRAEPLKLVADNSAPDEKFTPLPIKKGDYLINKAGFITRVDTVDADGNCVNVWNQPFLAYDMVKNGVEIFTPDFPAAGKEPFVKCIDGSNTRSILFEGVDYRVNQLYNSKYVEIVGCPGLFPIDIFTVLK